MKCLSKVKYYRTVSVSFWKETVCTRYNIGVAKGPLDLATHTRDRRASPRTTDQRRSPGSPPPKRYKEIKELLKIFSLSSHLYSEEASRAFHR